MPTKNRRWGRERKRYKQQGLLVEAEALEQAGQALLIGVSSKRVRTTDITLTRN